MSRSQHAPRLRLGLAIAACLAAALVAAPATAGAAKGDLRTRLDGLVSAGAPGAVLLVRDGARTQRMAAGLADVARERPMRPDDRLRIASLTKTYTATVVLQLVAERRLSLDDTVESRLPGLVPNGGAITIRQLLNHTSGLFDHEADERVLAPYLAGNFGHFWPARTLVEIAVSHPPLFAPGARHSYSNTNYVLLGLVVEAVTGKPIGRELRRRIFGPLGLRATEYPTTPRIAGRHAHGYLVVEQPPAVDVTGISPSLSHAAGAIVSNVTEVARFYRALLAGRLLRPGLLEAMKTLQPRRSRPTSPGSATASASRRSRRPAASPGATTARSPATSSTRSRARTAPARPCWP